MDIADTSVSTDILITAGIILFLIILSGFFSGSETSLTATSKARLLPFQKTKPNSTGRAIKLIEDKERLIGAILLGNNLVNILASALATGLFLNLFGEEGIIYATLVMTALVLIFAEVLPKSYAISNPDRMAIGVSGIISLLVTLFAPIILIVQQIVRVTLRLFGIDISNADNILSPQEEIRGAIDLHSEEGGIKRADRDMLGSILDFDDVDVYDIMVHRKSMEMVDIDLDPNSLLTAVVRSPHTRLPLYDGSPENIVGILHAKDLLRALRRAGGQIGRVNVRRIMTKPWFVPETTSLREQLNAFLERKAHFALVVDEYGDIQGLVTLEDILEEIVGDIADEHDFDLPGLEVADDNSVVVEGSVPIRDLNRKLDWSLNDEPAATVAGLLIYKAETIPIVGETFEFDGYRFEVTGRKRNQVTALKITRLAGAGSQEMERPLPVTR